MATRIGKNHYIASARHKNSPTPVHVSRNVTYSDDEGSQLAPSERTFSEYRSVMNAASDASPQQDGYDNNSDIYITSGAYRTASDVSSRAVLPSHYPYYAAPPSITGTSVKTRTSCKNEFAVETMAAPNPFCPNIKGMCCLLLLFNIGIVLITLGLVIIIQFFEPLYVRILGIIFLIFGVATLIGSLIYCAIICRGIKPSGDVNSDHLYWTHYWQKNIGTPEIHYKTEERYCDDKYSDKYSVGKVSGSLSDRGHNKY